MKNSGLCWIGSDMKGKGRRGSVMSGIWSFGKESGERGLCLVVI